MAKPNTIPPNDQWKHFHEGQRPIEKIPRSPE